MRDNGFTADGQADGLGLSAASIYERGAHHGGSDAAAATGRAGCWRWAMSGMTLAMWFVCYADRTNQGC